MDGELDEQIWPPEKEKTWFFMCESTNKGYRASFILKAKTADEVWKMVATKITTPPYTDEKREWNVMVMNRI